jgi:predicted secreted Zn-dependent protease
MKRALLAGAILAGSIFSSLGLLATAVPADAASVSRSYSYFNIGGTTPQELQRQLNERGPRLKSTGKRHPGAVEMQMVSRLTYTASPRSCRVSKAEVVVKAEFALPRWTDRARADAETRLLWEALSSDIRRHEEGHVEIARRFAGKLERQLLAMSPRSDCEAARSRAAEITRRVQAAQDEAQRQFDRTELAGFESRIMRLMDRELRRQRLRQR